MFVVEDLGAGLDEHLAKELLAKVTLIRMKQRQGLIKARMIGARNATGEVIGG